MLLRLWWQGRNRSPFRRVWRIYELRVKSFSRFRIHNYLLVSLIPVFGILGRLAKFFVLEYTDFVGIRS